MAPVRASEVHTALSFDAAVAALRPRYPSIDDEIDELSEVLRFDYMPPEIPIDPEERPGQYTINMDYPPLGADGRGRFQVTYHSTEREASWTTPYRTVTLLSIDDRSEWPAAD